MLLNALHMMNRAEETKANVMTKRLGSSITPPAPLLLSISKEKAPAYRLPHARRKCPLKRQFIDGYAKDMPDAIDIF